MWLMGQVRPDVGRVPGDTPNIDGKKILEGRDVTTLMAWKGQWYYPLFLVLLLLNFKQQQ